MRHRYLLLVIIFSLYLFQESYSQGFTRPNDWKKYRKEVVFQAGASEFLGDLGGLNKVGTDFSPADMEFALTRPAFSLAYRYKFTKNFNVHTSFNYLLVAGDDKLTTEQFRNNRNLNFKSNIFELAVRAEVSFFASKVGHRYGIKKTLYIPVKSSLYKEARCVLNTIEFSSFRHFLRSSFLFHILLLSFFF